MCDWILFIYCEQMISWKAIGVMSVCAVREFISNWNSNSHLCLHRTLLHHIAYSPSPRSLSAPPPPAEKRSRKGRAAVERRICSQSVILELAEPFTQRYYADLKEGSCRCIQSDAAVLSWIPTGMPPLAVAIAAWHSTKKSLLSGTSYSNPWFRRQAVSLKDPHVRRGSKSCEDWRRFETSLLFAHKTHTQMTKSTLVLQECMTQQHWNTYRPTEPSSAYN